MLTGFFIDEQNPTEIWRLPSCLSVEHLGMTAMSTDVNLDRKQDKQVRGKTSHEDLA
jgi:hypothetical protein